MGYLAQWAIYDRNYLVKNIVSSGSAPKLTHINYAFSNISDEHLCASGDGLADYEKAFDANQSVDGIADPATGAVLRGNFNQLHKLKLMYPHVKVLISIGGWSWSDEFSHAARPENRAAFVSSCIDMYIKGNFAPELRGYEGIFDGIDIDWEYPAACHEENPNCSPQDTQNFTALLTEFRSQLNALSTETHKEYLLTIAAPAGRDYYSKIELSDIHPYLDFINLMAFDFHGTWESVTNLHAPLYGALADPTHSQPLWADAAVQAYLSSGIPHNKLVLGVPFYGRGWSDVNPGPNGDGLYQPAGGVAQGKYEAGVNDYKELVLAEGNYSKYLHPEANSVWIYNGRDLWTYDDPTSLAIKMHYIKSLDLGGAMCWELSGDTNDGALITAIYNGLR